MFDVFFNRLSIQTLLDAAKTGVEVGLIAGENQRNDHLTRAVKAQRLVVTPPQDTVCFCCRGAWIGQPDAGVGRYQRAGEVRRIVFILHPQGAARQLLSTDNRALFRQLSATPPLNQIADQADHLITATRRLGKLTLGTGLHTDQTVHQALVPCIGVCHYILNRPLNKSSGWNGFPSVRRGRSSTDAFTRRA